MTKTSTQYKFQADLTQRPKQAVHPDSPDFTEPYIADPTLVKAVNLAIYLGRPLLLEGEAGCGKTRLASAIAYELGLPYYRWDVRSTSKAAEGLYSYDAVLRLHDVQTQKVDKNQKRQPSNPMDYITFGALGKAFQVEGAPAVVLIDEIDKADLDFPNDLLAVLDEPWEFEIGEVPDKAIKAEKMPIVIITSNKEKGDLPAPFLRRCIYYYVKFPSDEPSLKKIVDAHYKVGVETSRPGKKPTQALFKAAATRFLELRSNAGLFKKPGTSEFLDWLAALQSFEDKPYSANSLKKDKTIPYPELLIKLRSDWIKYSTAL